MRRTLGTTLLLLGTLAAAATAWRIQERDGAPPPLYTGGDCVPLF